MLKGLKSVSTTDPVVFSVNFMKNELGKTKNDEKLISSGGNEHGAVWSGVGFFTEIVFSGCLIAYALAIADATM